MDKKVYFLYLLSKYNQLILEETKTEIPEFFKKEFKEEILPMVEQGGSFEKAAKVVLSNCCKEVLLLTKGAKSQKDIIEKLHGRMVMQDKMVGEKCRSSKNHLEAKYLMSVVAGNCFDTIHKLKQKDLTIVKNKSGLFKNVIGYNSLSDACDRLEKGTVSLEELKKIS